MNSTDDTPRGELALRTQAFPTDANPAGDIFGGWIMSQMDIAAGITAGERARGRVATVSVDAMQFIRPVGVGDIVCVYAQVERIGRTSLTIAIDVWALRFMTGERERVTEGRFIFVALDETGRPRPVPEL